MSFVYKISHSILVMDLSRKLGMWEKIKIKSINFNMHMTVNMRKRKRKRKMKKKVHWKTGK